MNLAFDIFLLTLNLSQLHNKELIIKLFIEGMQEIFRPYEFKYIKNIRQSSGLSFTIKTTKSSFGTIQVELTEKDTDNNLMLIRNSVQMLAVILERLEFDQKLEIERDGFKSISLSKLTEIEENVKELEDSRRASINLIEDLNLEIERRKDAERAIKKTEKYFRFLIENAPDGVVLVSKEGKMTYASPAARSIFGYPDNLIEFPDPNESTHPDDLPNILATIHDIVQNPEKVITVKYRFRNSEGKWLWVESTFANHFADEGIEALVINFRDITAKKAAEDSLIASEEKFRNLFEHSPVGKSMTGVDGTINVNKAFCNMLGYTSGELRLKKWKEISHPDDIPMTDEIVNSLISGESDSARIEKRYIHKNGCTVYTDVTTYLQRDSEGNPQFFITTVSDITDRKLAESKLLASEERFSLAISASEQGIWDWNVETNEVFFSEQWKRQIGYEDSEIENDFNSWIELLHPDDKEPCLQAVQTYLNKPAEHFIIEFRFRHKDGSYRIIHNKASSVLSTKGKVLRMFGTHTDITERKQAEEEIRKLNETLEQRVIDRTAQLKAANSELEAFSYSVSHDLRAPLRAIHSFTSILKEDYKDLLDAEGKRICGLIESSSVHMGRLIDDLLAFSRISRTEIQHSRIDMKKMIVNVVDDLLSTDEKKKIKINLKKLPNVYGDYATIRQVLINLISNAIKYSSKNESPEITVGCEMNNITPVFYVKDNGVGFNMLYEEKLFKVFQRLHSTKEFEGNGVGLAIVHRIISKHGGRVWAEGEVGKGATFYFTLPGEKAVDNRQ